MLLLKQYQRDSTQLVRMSERLFATSTTQCREDAGRIRNFDAQTILDDEKKGVFRVLQIGKPKDGGKRQLRRRGGSMIPPPQRADMMKPDQAWGDVWPAARTFHPAVVPLPVRQGVVQQKAQVVPSKHANAELMKVPNFLHLSPPVVSQHCAALARFCTAWPEGLDTEEDVEEHFPITLTYSDYLNSSSSVRDRRSRIVQIRINIKALPLDEHARDKLIRLVGERYNEETGEILLVSDRCPYRGQNEDYCKYLLTALLHESWRVEDWEVKGVADMEKFVMEEAGEREALHSLLNQGETEVTVARYREEVRKMLGLPATVVSAETVSN